MKKIEIGRQYLTRMGDIATVQPDNFVDEHAKKILEIAATEFPIVTKRKYTQPDHLQYKYGSCLDSAVKAHNEEQAKWETVWVRDVIIEDRSTEKQARTTYHSDIFMRRNDIPNAPWQYAYSNKSHETAKKFPAIGGPLVGKMITRNTPDYVQFNCGEYNSKAGYYNAFMIHKDIAVKEEKKGSAGQSNNQ
jgi:hypothetical protein